MRFLVSPIVANLFMEWFEEASNSFTYEIRLWHRYVNDTMVIVCDALLDDLTSHITSIHPAIQFMREEESDGLIAMLDAKILWKPGGTLAFTV